MNMKPSTTISEMLSGRSIVVPNYQRAYSWDTDKGADRSSKQVNTFLTDLQDYVGSCSDTGYYIGHFLFEKLGDNKYAIVDGQQRLTTAVIFVAALYKRLLAVRQVDTVEALGDDLSAIYSSIVKRGIQYPFSTVEYDKNMFRDYVIDQTTKDRNGLDTVSKERIADAFDYFTWRLSGMAEGELLPLLHAIAEASCSAHVVEKESDAVQMFIFQNNRGKRPTNLEVIKAQLMYHVHLYAASVEERKSMLEEITSRFEEIYKSISQVEANIDEDSVLSYAINIHRNTLYGTNAKDFVNEELGKDGGIKFIQEFTRLLSACFKQITVFFDEEKKNMDYHALAVSGKKGVFLPIMIKAMLKGTEQGEMNGLARALEQISLRDRIIPTRADLISRLNNGFQEKGPDQDIVRDIIGRIILMKTHQGSWWRHWGDEALAHHLTTGGISHNTAKILLWKYENYLIKDGKSGYSLIRYSDIKNPHLEHIAPQTENQEENSGYCTYDDEFRRDYLNCLGNYLLTSGSHNMSLGNERFEKKRDSYKHLQQQIEVRDMTEDDKLWDKGKIDLRHENIVAFLKSVL